MSAVFITLYDEETLKLYLSRGVYGFLMAPVRGSVQTRSRHYHALADYACMRAGSHVFFFIQRRVVYAGQVKGSSQYGAFLINGDDSPLGRLANAPLCWDESHRGIYQPTEEAGVFTVTDVGERCQPYLLLFEDRLGLKGKFIRSDDLYWACDYGYLYPQTLYKTWVLYTTPRETQIAETIDGRTYGTVVVQTTDTTI
jgi:hypothetical protein